MTKKEKINLAREYFGLTIKEATTYVKTASDSIFVEIKRGLNNQASKAFYED